MILGIEYIKNSFYLCSVNKTKNLILKTMNDYKVNEIVRCKTNGRLYKVLKVCSSFVTCEEVDTDYWYSVNMVKSGFRIISFPRIEKLN